MVVLGKLVLMFFIGFTGFCSILQANQEKEVNVQTENLVGLEAIQQANTLSSAFRMTSRKVIPAVVKIVVHRTSGDKDIPKRNLPFGDLFPSLEKDDDIEGIGSGVLVEPGGLILTNNHVVSNKKNITVELFDGRQYNVTEVKKDSRSDLAILSIDCPETLPYLKFADSEKLEIGDWVLAIGNPFMLESSVSAGIISATKRTLGKKDHGVFIQTDAAVNPGNSGGPLVDLQGNIIGINTAIASMSGGNQGIGFAIPSNTARWIMEQLRSHGKVMRAYLGGSLIPLTYKERKTYSLLPREGVRLETTYKDSPAAKAGLRRNDILLSFDGLSIHSPEDFDVLVESADTSKEHILTVLRMPDSKKITVPVQLEIIPDNYIGVPVTEKLVEKGKHYNDKELGLMLIPVTPTSARNLGLKTEKGLVVLSAVPVGCAFKAGLRVGMVITSVNDMSISNTSDFQTARNNIKEQKIITIGVTTKNGPKTFEVTLKSEKE